MTGRPRWRQILDSSKREALLAVELYNRPQGGRYLEAHIVHMHLGWLYLLQAWLEKNHVDYRYRDDHGRFLRTKDGDVKTWELAECVRWWKKDDSNPVRKNIEFFHRFEE